MYTLANLQEPQGVFYGPATNHLLVACGGDGVTEIFDGTTFQLVASVYVLTNAGFLDVFQADADHYTRIAQIPTPPGAQTGLFVPALDKLFVGVPAREKQNAEVRVFLAR